MTLSDINEKWITYKKEYHFDSPVLIEEISFDAAKGVEASFDITELYSGEYILHLGEKFPLYRSGFADFVLWHEFTHLYDFLTQPYSYKVLRKVYIFMNTYSEYHASRRVLGRILDSAYGREFDPEKNVIPMAYKDISLRSLVGETLHRAEVTLHYFKENPGQKAFQVYFRFVMYLMGYVSHFANGKDIIKYCLEYLKVEEEAYLVLYDLMREKDYFKIISHMQTVYEEAGLT